jgi:hypothetical protein
MVKHALLGSGNHHLAGGSHVPKRLPVTTDSLQGKDLEAVVLSARPKVAKLVPEIESKK